MAPAVYTRLRLSTNWLNCW